MLVNLTIDGVNCQVEEGTTLLEAAQANGITIPTLCWMKDVNQIGACRMCIVEMEGAKSLIASCVYPVTKFEEGKVIHTHSKKVLESRKTTLQLLLSTHDQNCLACSRSGNCELQQLCRDLGVENSKKFDGATVVHEIDTSSCSVVRDNNKCINCRRCVAACAATQGIGVIGANNRGFKTEIGCAYDMNLAESACVSCGQCIIACPTGALTERDDTEKVWAALNDPNKIVVVQTAPSVRASLGEAFGHPIGTSVEGKMPTALKMLGFDAVFDTNFSADLTIMEEATELLHRITNNGVLPMITSCSPGWVRFCEAYFPEMIPHLSTCKSPQQMHGAMIKSYWAEKNNIDPSKIVSVSVMPCTAKKFEIGRSHQSGAGKNLPDLDISITTREFARMIQKAGINFNAIPNGTFDSLIGSGSGAGVIFGATGGVMEAALRTAVWKLTGEDPQSPIEFVEVRGIKGIKFASYKIKDLEVKVAVASGLANARELLNKVKNKEVDVHFIEIMACPGGCVNGGGQVIVPSQIRNFTNVREKRAGVVYKHDVDCKIRKSHENPEIIEVYDKYLGKPGGHCAHELLHTHYRPSELVK